MGLGNRSGDRQTQPRAADRRSGRRGGDAPLHAALVRLVAVVPFVTDACTDERDRRMRGRERHTELLAAARIERVLGG